MSPRGREPLWRRYLRLVRPDRYLRLVRPDVEADVDDELRFHLEMRRLELERRGLGPEEAEREALRRFGDFRRVSRWLRTHDQRRERSSGRRQRLAMFRQYFKQAARGLVLQPAFTLTAVLTLGLGIGATIAIFQVVNGVLIQPLPFAEPERLVSLGHTTPVAPGISGQAHATWRTYARLSRTLAAVGIHTPTAVNLTNGDRSERVAADSATAGVFAALGVAPMIGRGFTADDERPGQAPVVLLSERLWRRRFAGDPAVVGRKLLIDGMPHEVIGVLPERFDFPSEQTDVWLPLVFPAADPTPILARYAGVGRLRPGVTLEAAAGELDALLPRIVEEFPIGMPGLTTSRWLELVRPRASVRPLRDEVVGDIGQVLWAVFGTIGFLLLAACTNVATLFVVRAEGRGRELAVRAALGGGRWDAFRRSFAEGLLIAAAGALVAVGLAQAALSALRATTAFPIPRLAEVRMDAAVWAATVGVTVVVALFVGVLPVLRHRLADVAIALRGGGRGTTLGRDRRRVHGVLVAVQVALGFVLLAASSLMARTFVELRQVELGFDTEQSLVFSVALPAATYPTDTAVTEFQSRLLDRLSALPGVEGAAITSWLPLAPGRIFNMHVWAEGVTFEGRDGPPARVVPSVTAGYFDALAIPFLAGRTFRELAPGQTSFEVVATDGFVAATWAGSRVDEAIGRRVRVMPEGPWLTIVGVVTSVRHVSADRPPAPGIYLPLASAGFGPTLSTVPREIGVVLRTRDAPAVLGNAVAREVAALDPLLPVYGLRPMVLVATGSIARTSFTALVLGIAALVAVALGALGLYGVVAYTVGLRRREIGLRLALGARPGALVGMMAGEGAGLAAAGIAVGLAAAFAVTRTLRALLFGVSATDPLALGAAVVLLLAVAVAASWIPARRAARVDPASVLSAE